MEDDTFHVVVIIGLVILIISVVVAGGRLNTVQARLESKMQCSEIIDTIYENCLEERNITLTTMKGRTANLYAEYGACIIRPIG